MMRRKMMTKLIVLRGLPGSGKTTWAKDYLLSYPEAVRVNRDDLRAMFHGRRPWNRDDEHVTTMARDQLITSNLLLGRDVISDDPNLNQYHIDHFQTLAGACNTEIEVIPFTPTVEECIRRDRQRAISVGEEVIRNMAATMELDTPFESPKK
jgi:predicted kinase